MFNDHEIKQYCRTVTKQCPRAYRKKLRETVVLAVTEYADTHPAASMQDFEQHFGTPQQFVDAFLDTLPAKEKQYYIKRSKVLTFCAVAALAFFVAAVSITAIVVIADNHAGRAIYKGIFIENQ